MISAMLTTERVVRTTPLSLAAPLSARLRDIHRRWMDDVSEWLSPALAPDADFWNGWSAVRYLDDQFARRYRRERTLVAAILPLVRPSDAFILCATAAVLERTRRDLDQIGRRQGMTEAVAVLGYRFLKLLRTWFAEIERVTEELTIHEASTGRTARPRTARGRRGHPAVKPLSASRHPGVG
jgi:hypothetical protein